MIAQELRSEILGLLADVRSAGRGASRASFEAVVDRRIPRLVSVHDPFEGARLSDNALAALRTAVSAACDPHLSEPQRSRARFTFPVSWQWGIAGVAALVLILFAVYTFRPSSNRNIVNRPEPSISQPNPLNPGISPPGDPTIAKDSGPETSEPAPRIRRPHSPYQDFIAEKQKEPEINLSPIPGPGAGPRERVAARVVVGTLRTEMGSPLVHEPGGGAPIPVKEKMAVLVGATIETRDMDKAELLLKDGSTLRLGFNTTLVLRNRGGAGFIPGRDFVLSSGTIFAHVAPTKNRQKFAIQTPVATAEVLGTEFSLGIERVSGSKRDPKGGAGIRAVLQVKSGRVKFYNEVGDVQATAMEESTAVAGERPTDPRRVPTLKTYLISSGDSNWYTSDSTRKLDEQGAVDRLVFATDWMGLSVALRSDGRVRILEVFHDSPASTSGLEVGDVLLSLDGEPVRSPATLRRRAVQQLGGKIDLEVDRQGQKLLIAVESTRKGPSLPALGNALASRLHAATSPALMGSRTESLLNLRTMAATAPNAAVFNNLGIVHEMGDEMGPAIRSYQAAVRLEPRVALYHFNLGLALQSIGNLVRAVEELEAAVALEPDHHDATIALARAYFIVERFDDALRLLDSASSASPNCPHFLIVKGFALSRGKRHDEAVVALEHALRIDPDNLWAHNVHAAALKYGGRFVEAEKVLRKVMELDPGNNSPVVDLGSLLERMRRFGEAETMLRSAIAIEPDSSGAHAKLGLMLGRLGRSDEAEKELREAIRLGEHAAPVYSNHGIVLRSLRRFKEAEHAHRKAIELDPGFALAYTNLGNVLYDTKQFAEAANMHRRAIELAPTEARIHLNLGFALNALNRPMEAETAFRTAMQLDPRNFDAHYELGNLLRNQFRDREAEPVLRKATELNPNHFEAHVHLGVVLLRLRRYPDADIVLRKAIALQPSNSNAYANLGAVLEEAGRKAEAEPMYRKAAELEPKNADWHIALGHLLDSMERFTDSVSAFQEAVKADPKRASSYAELGWSLIKTHQWSDAVSAYRRCIKIDPKGPTALNAMNSLANALLQTGDVEEAYSLSEHALKIKPNDPESQSTRAYILAHKGIRLDEALQLAKKGVESANVSAQRWYVLGFVHFKRSELDQAIEPLKKAAQDYKTNYLAADAWMTLGAVYEAKNDTASAVDAYRRALKIEPANSSAAAALKRLAP